MPVKRQKTTVVYNDKQYTVIKIPTEKNGVSMIIPTIIDTEDLEKIRDIRLNRVGNYIGNNKLFLHHVIMEHEFDGRLYVDHINRICQDNRKENLRLATQTEQNHNQRKRTRTLTLPTDCGFGASEIPTNVEYHAPCGGHDASFEVTIQLNGKKIFRKRQRKVEKLVCLKN